MNKLFASTPQGAIFKLGLQCSSQHLNVKGETLNRIGYYTPDTFKNLIVFWICFFIALNDFSSSFSLIFLRPKIMFKIFCWPLFFLTFLQALKLSKPLT